MAKYVCCCAFQTSTPRLSDLGAMLWVILSSGGANPATQNIRPHGSSIQYHAVPGQLKL